MALGRPRPQTISPLQTEGDMEVVERKRQMEGTLPKKNPRIYWLSLRSQRWLWLFKAPTKAPAKHQS